MSLNIDISYVRLILTYWLHFTFRSVLGVCMDGTIYKFVCKRTLFRLTCWEALLLYFGIYYYFLKYSFSIKKTQIFHVPVFVAHIYWKSYLWMISENESSYRFGRCLSDRRRLFVYKSDLFAVIFYFYYTTVSVEWVYSIKKKLKRNKRTLLTTKLQ